MILTMAMRTKMVQKLGTDTFEGMSIFSDEFDCDWNNISDVQNDCQDCYVCEYWSFKEFPETLGLPPYTSAQYNIFLDKYIKVRYLSLLEG